MDRQSFYRPTDRGIEARIKARLDEWARLRGEREP
jgi:putative ATPase